MIPGTHESGEYLCSDQGAAIESLILNNITHARHMLESLTFEDDHSLQNQRTRDSALLLCDALWRIIYYANGS